MAAQTKTPVVKAVMCRISGEVIATVKVPSNVKSIKLAGTYSVNGDACNVSVNKVTKDKRVINKLRRFETPEAIFHEKSGTYYIEVPAIL